MEQRADEDGTEKKKGRGREGGEREADRQTEGKKRGRESLP